MRLGMPLLAWKMASKASAEIAGAWVAQPVSGGVRYRPGFRRHGPIGPMWRGGNRRWRNCIMFGLCRICRNSGWPIKEALQQGLVAVLEVGKHAQFFHRPGGQILRFIDDQQAALALGGHADQEGLRATSGRRIWRHPSCAGQMRKPTSPQGVVGIELRADQLGGDDFLGIQPLQQAPHDGRFPAPTSPVMTIKPFILVHAVLKVGLGAAVLLAPEIEVGVRVELERLAGRKP